MKKSKNMLIVGASSGIGEALAYEAAKAGQNIAITGRRVENLQRIANKIRQTSDVQVIVRAMDVLDETQMIYDTMCDISSELKGIDTVVINAGVITERKLGTLDVSSDANIINTNVTGAISVGDAAIKLFVEQTADDKIGHKKGKTPGHIVVTSSVSAFIPLPTNPAYAASKAAVTHYYEGIRGRLNKRNIKLTILHPGFIKTAMTERTDISSTKLIMADVDVAAKAILNAIQQKKPTAMIPPQPWRLIGTAYHLTPSFLRRRLVDFI